MRWLALCLAWLAAAVLATAVPAAAAPAPASAGTAAAPGVKHAVARPAPRSTPSAVVHRPLTLAAQNIEGRAEGPRVWQAPSLQKAIRKRANWPSRIHFSPKARY